MLSLQSHFLPCEQDFFLCQTKVILQLQYRPAIWYADIAYTELVFIQLGTPVPDLACRESDL